jgi:CDP-2,3-bis-(O-geranylgeranyl)-sn-glycerol synthase
MLHDVAFALWFLLPAALANVAPIISNVVPGLKNWNTPIDGGRQFRGKELLGSHKTWRGIVVGMVTSTIVLWLQKYAVNHFDWLESITRGVDYDSLPTLLLGPLFGLGALGGDAVESFFKRQKGIKSGHTWVPFDQLDYIVGGIVVSLPFVRLWFWEYAYIVVIWFAAHLIASYIGWLLGLKERPI